MKTLRYRKSGGPESKGLQGSPKTAKTRIKSFTSWKDLSDSAVLRRAQEAIDRNGFRDWQSFIDVYKGIRVEILKRGLSRDELTFHTDC